MSFNLNDYEPVADRLTKFWADHPDGRITTKIEHLAAGAVIISAQIFRDAADPAPAATGLAEETRTERGVNATSFVENAETSAIGRALANFNYASKGATARPSREEMAKVQRGQRPVAEDQRSPVQKLIEVAARAGVDEQRLVAELRERHHITATTLPEILAGLTDEQKSAAYRHYRDIAELRAQTGDVGGG